MASPERAGLIQAVRRGDRDAVWALADWLEEHGDEADQARAEHMRLDLRARASAELVGQEWVEARLSELCQRWGPVWLGKALILRGVQKWSLDLGLLWVWLRPAVLKKDRLAVIAELVEDGWLAGIRCEGWKARSLGRLFRSSALAGVPALEVIRCRNGPFPMSRLVASPHLSALERLRVVQSGLDARAIRRLAQASNLSALTSLEFPFNALKSAGLAALARSPVMPRLSRLDVQSNDIGPAGARAVARADLAAGLNLKLSFNRLTCRGATYLARSEALGRLAELDLSWNGIQAVGGEALVAAPALPPVVAVDGNDLGLSYQTLRARLRGGGFNGPCHSSPH